VTLIKSRLRGFQEEAGEEVAKYAFLSSCSAEASKAMARSACARASGPRRQPGSAHQKDAAKAAAGFLQKLRRIFFAGTKLCEAGAAALPKYVCGKRSIALL